LKEYLDALERSLRKKKSLLDQILEKSREQAALLKNEDLTPEDFDRNVEEKAALIEELVQCDSGFDQVYERIREKIKSDKAKYREEIAVIQDLIREVTARSTSIQAEEARNREAAERKFSTIKRQIRESNSSAQAVNRYYQNMMKINYVDPQFLDDKH
jgi:hypothetical protein